MRRRSHIVSRETVVAPIELPTPITNNNNNNSNNNKIKKGNRVHDIPPPAPTLNLFERFQQKNSDFTGEWVMMEEAGDPLPSPISLEVVNKLRQHQGEMQKQRGGGGVSTHKEVKITSVVSNNNNKEEEEEEEDDEDNDDEEYAPRKMEIKTKPQELIVQEEIKGKEENNNNEDEESSGIRGDYLSLLPTDREGKDVAKSDLQAILPIQDGRGIHNSLMNSSKQQEQQQKEKYSTIQSSLSSPTKQRVVPLWCVERFTKNGGYSSNSLIALHQEICDFVKYLQPSEGEISMRRLIEMEIRTIAKRLWPECEPVVYGSMRTKLLLPLSDLDMTILNVPVSTEEALTLLAREISRESLCHTAYPQLILKTKVPLVKFQHRLSMLDVDISVNAADGRRNTAIVMEMLNNFPEARPLTVVIKYFLQQRGMHEPYHGGLGSFATTLLVISFLQNHPIYTDHPEERAYSGLGRLLVDFFRYYGLYFSYERCGISLLEGGRYFRRRDGISLGGNNNNNNNNLAQPARGQLGPPQVLIEDPGCPQNNAASSLRNFHVISSVFAHAYMALTAVFDTQVESNSSSSYNNNNNNNNNGMQSFSPDSNEIARRPTLLSRILHVDAPSVARRQSIATAFETLLQDPEQQEKIQAIANHRTEEEKEEMLNNNNNEIGKPSSNSKTGTENISDQAKKRPRQKSICIDSNSSSESSNNSNSTDSKKRRRTCSSEISSNDSSVRVVSHRCRRLN